MLKRLSELINQAEICLENPGLSEGTIEDYRHSAFHPLERRLDTKEYVDSAAILSQEEFFWEQYEKGQISRHTLHFWRLLAAPRCRDYHVLACVSQEETSAGGCQWPAYRRHCNPEAERY